MGKQRHRLVTALGGAVLVIGLAGCTGDDITVVTDDGTVSVDGDRDGGSISIDSSEGSVRLSAESDGELPEQWPDNLALPEGGSINSSASFASPEGEAWQVTVVYPDSSPTDLISQLKSTWQDAGFTVAADVTAAGQTVANFVGDGRNVTATAGEDDQGAAVLIVVVAPEA